MAAAKKTLKVNDDLTLKLPAKLPFAAVRHVNGESVDVPPLLEVILGADQAEMVWNAGLDIDQGSDLVDQIIGQYGVDTGK